MDKEEEKFRNYISCVCNIAKDGISIVRETNDMVIKFGGKIGVSQLIGKSNSVFILSELTKKYNIPCDKDDMNDFKDVPSRPKAILIFDKVESIDALISSLQLSKERLIKEREERE
jgi:hypothetical protein